MTASVDQHLVLDQRIKYFNVQQLIAELAVKRLILATAKASPSRCDDIVATHDWIPFAMSIRSYHDLKRRSRYILERLLPNKFVETLERIGWFELVPVV